MPITMEPFPRQELGHGVLRGKIHRGIFPAIHFESPLPIPTAEGDFPNMLQVVSKHLLIMIYRRCSAVV